MPETSDIEIKKKADVLRSTIELHCNIFKNETGHFPLIKVSPKMVPAYGCQDERLIGVNIEISIDL